MPSHGAPNDVGLFGRRLMLFTGKGGVGKTTVVAALAMHAASLGLRPLVVELGHRASMRSVFGTGEIGFRPHDVGHGVHVMSMDLDHALLETIVEHVRSRRLARTILDNGVLDRLFKAMPAVSEVATLHKLRAFEAERDGARPRWGPILVDLDATGHALMFLELRNVVGSLLGAGPLRAMIDGGAELLADERRTRLHLVTTPDELPVTETIELHQRLLAANTVTMGRMFVNRVPRRPWSIETDGELPAVRRAALAIGDDETLRDVAFAELALARVERARARIARLRARLPLPCVELPALPVARLGPTELAQLGRLAASEVPS